MKKEEPSSMRRFWISMALLLAFLIIATFIAAVLGGNSDGANANTAIVKITGPIASEDDSSFLGAGGASSTEIVRELEKARDDSKITAVILEINSPGGSAVASDEIAQAVKAVKAQNKTVVAWIRESGASGAYWIASSTDHIVANRMSITGSIGVISSYMQFDQFIASWNISYNRLIAGENKDIGDPFTNLTGERRAFMQHKLNTIHSFFIEEVARNRNMSVAQVTRLASGEFYLGVEAKEEGLIDEIGGKNEAIRFIEARTGKTVETTEYAPERSFIDELLGVASKQRAPTLQDLARQEQLLQQTSVPMLR